MTTAAIKKSAKNNKSVRHIKARVTRANDKMMGLSHQASAIYNEAMKRVRKQPREAAGLCLGLGILASMVIWYRFVK